MTDHPPGALLRAIVEKLEAMGIPHMVVGSFASTVYGEPRSTRDLDLVIDPTPEQLNRLLAALDPDDYYVDPDVARDALRRRSMSMRAATVLVAAVWVAPSCWWWRLTFASGRK